MLARFPSAIQAMTRLRAATNKTIETKINQADVNGTALETSVLNVFNKASTSSELSATPEGDRFDFMCIQKIKIATHRRTSQT
jgi:hypothetical protein